jgi:putative hydrolase of the HAD superfamily
MLNRPMLDSYLRPLAPIATDLKPYGNVSQPVKCILFDVYGTLLIGASGDTESAVDSERLSSRLFTLLERYRIDKTPQQLKQELDAAVDAAHQISKEMGIEFPEVQIVDIWRQILKSENITDLKAFALEYELITNPVYPMPDLMNLLATCRKCQVAMGIISNAQFYTPLMFEYFCDTDLIHLGFHPDLIFFSYQFGMAKPSSHLFAAAIERLRKLNIAPEETLFLGNDMLKDIYPANQAGMQTALFAGDRRSLRLRRNHPLCQHLVPLILVTDLNQIATLLANQKMDGLNKGEPENRNG